MKKYIIFIMSLLLISCSFEIEKEILMEIIKNIDNDFQNTQIISNVEKNNIDMGTGISDNLIDSFENDKFDVDKGINIKNKDILDENIAEINNNISGINSNIDEKLLDIKFYSQFPTHDFNLPFEEYCEEASLLNGIYYLNNLIPNIDDYVDNLNTIKDIEDKLFGENGYKNTSINQTNLILNLFQNPEYIEIYLSATTDEQKNKILKKLEKINKDKGYILGKIILDPSINDLENEINKGNPVIIPVHGRALKNIHFTIPGPIYHNILLKGYNSENFIFNEVGTIWGESYVYSKDLIINNIFDFNKDLYPENFTSGDSKVLILYK